MGLQYTGAMGNVQVISPDRTLILSVNAIVAEQRFGAKIAAQTAEPYYQIHQVSILHHVFIFSSLPIIFFFGGSSVK
jgi:hypothetical protein